VCHAPVSPKVKPQLRKEKAGGTRKIEKLHGLKLSELGQAMAVLWSAIASENSNWQ